MVILNDIIEAIEAVAPVAWQESYDNAGLQVGNRFQSVSGVVICLDVTEAVVDEAIALGYNLIVSHHPLLFKGLKSITGSSCVERIVVKAIQHNIAIYAAHTNLDNAPGGVSFRMARKLGLIDVRVLDPMPGLLMKLVTYVPESHVEQVRTALFEAGAGHTGNYDQCSFGQAGEGTFRPGLHAKPYCGVIGELHREPETRLEVIVPVYAQGAVMAALKRSHPYEEPAFDWIPLANRWEQVGAGVVGHLPEPVDEMLMLEKLKETFEVGCVKHSPLHGRKISRIALCGGAGASLMSKAVAAGADMFVTGEIRYHDYFEFESHILLAEIGHYESEQYTKEIFCEIIQKKFPTFAIHSTQVDTNPINYL
ncbi:Nif3-like dinuclear metal center hexameric protein [Barnesiella viscericola]|uniref:Nif3-like dinuclear metal center hexameric protein n=1 Tax=Barnesiella viscericola TaxID=397865 RepID=UPI0023556233|nr:Nif3-like dinuclear metal center hexameric protein [Barnesiella viscericola]